MLKEERKIQILKNKINNKDQEIKRLLKTLDYIDKDFVLKTLTTEELNLSLREEILKILKQKISEENRNLSKRKFKKTLKR